MHAVNFIPIIVLLLQNVVKMIHADCMLYKLSKIFSTLVSKTNPVHGLQYYCMVLFN